MRIQRVHVYHGRSTETEILLSSCYQGQFRMAVLAVGAPACGANAAVRSFVRMCLVEGYSVYGVYDSLVGLASGNVKPLSWTDVHGWAGAGGSKLGTKR